MRSDGAAQIVLQPRQPRPQEATPLVEAKGLRKEYRLKTGCLSTRRSKP